MPRPRMQLRTLKGTSSSLPGIATSRLTLPVVLVLVQVVVVVVVVRRLAVMTTSPSLPRMLRCFRSRGRIFCAG